MKKLLLPVLTLFLFTIHINTYGDINTLETNASISAEDKVTNPGDTVLVAVTATGFQDIGSFDCHIAFNNNVLDTISTAVTVVNIHPNISGALYNVVHAENNIDKVLLSWSGMASASIPDGEKLFDLQFIFCDELYSCALDGTSASLNFIESATHFTTGDFVELPLDYHNGSVSGPDLLKALTLNQSGEGQVMVDGSPYEEPAVVLQGVSLDLEAIPETDWDFDGWSGDITGTENPTSVTMDDHKFVNVTFSPEFEPEQYTLTVTLVGSGDVEVNGVSYSVPVTAEEGTTLNLEAIADEWWLFDSWSGDLVSNNTTETITMDGNKTITATFVRDQFTLTAHTTGEGNVEVDGQTYDEPLLIDAGTEVTLEALPANDWIFDHWSGDLSGSENPQTLLVDQHKVVTATFEMIPPGEYSLTVITDGEGTVEVDGQPYTQQLTFIEGTTISLEAFPNQWWLFNEWSGDLDGDNPIQTITMDGNKTITATFVRDQFTLTAHTTGEGSVEVDGQTYDEPLLIDAGTEVTLEALPDQGWEFAGWSGDLDGDENPTDLLIDEDVEVSATMIPDDLSAGLTDDKKINVYPIPARDRLYVESRQNIEEIRVFNALGTMVYQMDAINQQRVELNLEQKPAGFYILQIQADGEWNNIRLQIISH